MNSNSQHYVRKTPLIETMDVTDEILKKLLERNSALQRRVSTTC